MARIVLCNISDAPQVIAEERHFWIHDVLIGLGIPEETIAQAGDIDTYRYLMGEEGIEVEMTSNGDVNVYKMRWHNGPTEYSSDWLPPDEDSLVGQWKEPTYVRKIDGKEVYYELHLNEWSILNMRHDNE